MGSKLSVFLLEDLHRRGGFYPRNFIVFIMPCSVCGGSSTGPLDFGGESVY